LQYRGLTRNDQIKECDADFMLFSDGDHVHSNDFFSKMNKLLLDEFKDCMTIMSYKRKSTFLEETERFIDNYTYPNNIPEAFEKASKLQYRLASFCCGGGIHLVSTKAIIERNNGLYVPEDRCRDISWGKYTGATKSDIQFRKAMRCCAIPLPRVIHLQHARDRNDRKNFNIQK